VTQRTEQAELSHSVSIQKLGFLFDKSTMRTFLIPQHSRILLTGSVNSFCRAVRVTQKVVTQKNFLATFNKCATRRLQGAAHNYFVRTFFVAQFDSSKTIYARIELPDLTKPTSKVAMVEKSNETASDDQVNLEMCEPPNSS
jgi:hypothetical protein